MNGAITLSEPRPRLRWSHQDRHLVDGPQTAASQLSCFSEGQTAPPEPAPHPRPAHLLSGELSYPVLEPQDGRRDSGGTRRCPSAPLDRSASFTSGISSKMLIPCPPWSTRKCTPLYGRRTSATAHGPFAGVHSLRRGCYRTGSGSSESVDSSKWRAMPPVSGKGKVGLP